MSDLPNYQPSARPRAGVWGQLFTGALVIAIAVLGVWLAIAGRQAIALQRELANLRTEAGYLEIHDRSKVYAVWIPSLRPNEWAWRIYLPENHTYMIYNYRGLMPVLADSTEPDRAAQTRSGTGSYGSIPSGEFVIRFRVEEGSNGQWLTKVVTRTGMSSVGSVPRSGWLSNRDWNESSAIPKGEQREFPADATFDLIRLRQESAVDSNDPQQRVETIALWISGAATNDP